MIVELTMFTVACDNCQEEFSSEDFCAWDDADSARYQSEESGWIHKPERQIGQPDKHYCPNCWEVDDNDEYVIKPIPKVFISQDSTYPCGNCGTPLNEHNKTCNSTTQD